jgi:hypothetical protein
MTDAQSGSVVNWACAPKAQANDLEASGDFVAVRHSIKKSLHGIFPDCEPAVGEMEETGNTSGLTCSLMRVLTKSIC